MNQLFVRFPVMILAILVGGCGTPSNGEDAESGAQAANGESTTRSGPGLVVIRMLDDMSFDPSHAVVTAGDTG